LENVTAVVRFCNKRGTAEQWIKEQTGVKISRFSWHRFRANQLRLWLSARLARLQLSRYHGKAWTDTRCSRRGQVKY
jgi:hypothetical protein